MKWCLMSSEIRWHIRDKLRPMPKHGSVLLYVHGNQKARQDGQPWTATSTLHSSWTMTAHTWPHLDSPRGWRWSRQSPCSAECGSPEGRCGPVACARCAGSRAARGGPGWGAAASRGGSAPTWPGSGPPAAAWRSGRCPPGCTPAGTTGPARPPPHPSSSSKTPASAWLSWTWTWLCCSWRSTSRVFGHSDSNAEGMEMGVGTSMWSWKTPF